jgi:hypothetical protein
MVTFIILVLRFTSNMAPNYAEHVLAAYNVSKKIKNQLIRHQWKNQD